MQDDKHDWREILGAFIVLALILGLVVAATDTWPGVVVFMKEGGYAGWAGAVASVFTGVVALTIANRATAKQNDDAFDKATLIAARVSVMVGEFADELTQCHKWANASQIETTNTFGPTTIAKIQAASAMLRGIRPDDLSALIPLPDNVGQRLARAIALQESLHALVTKQLTYSVWLGPTQTDTESWRKSWSEKRRIAMHWKSRMDEILDLLAVVGEGLAAATEIGAPRPSENEIYGAADEKPTDATGRTTTGQVP